MGKFVNGHWREDLVDDYGQGDQPHQSAPAPSPSHNMGNTNNQSVRADLRKQGYYIDDSGVYAPGAGQRVGDTWSGANSQYNVAPSPTRLPIINGHPVSPSNGFSGVQTPYIMYRGDPDYAKYFGADTPGYNSTSMAANALPGALPEGQATYGSLPSVPAQPAQSTTTTSTYQPQANPTAPAVLPPGSNISLSNLTAGDGQHLGDQDAATQAQFHAAYGNNAEQAWVQEHNKAIGSNATQGSAPVAPQAPPQAPQTTPGSPQPQTAPPSGGQPPRVPGEPETPSQFGQPQDLVPITMPDGSIAQVPREFYQEYLAAGQAQAAAAAAARQFDQGIAQGQLDIQKMVATYNKAYQDALIAGQAADRAQQMAIEQMHAELQKQSLELQKQLQAQTAQYQQQQIELGKGQQAATLSIEREKLAEQRRQSRGHRRLPQVRTR